MSTEKIHQSELLLWDRILSLMHRENLTAKDLAAISKVVPSAVAKWKNGGSIGSDKLQRIANHFGESVDWLLGRDDSPTPDQLLNRGVKKFGKGSEKTEKPGNIEDSETRDTPAPTLEKGRGLADYPRMEPVAKDEAALSNARQLIATMKEREDGDRLLGQLATMLMWLNTAIHPDMEADVKATALRQAHLVCDKLGGVPSPSA